MPLPIPSGPNSAGRYGLWISLIFWGEIIICLILVGEQIIPFGIALALMTMTVLIGISYCISGYRRPQNGAAIAGLVILAIDIFVLGCLAIAANFGSGLRHL